MKVIHIGNVAYLVVEDPKTGELYTTRVAQVNSQSFSDAQAAAIHTRFYEEEE